MGPPFPRPAAAAVGDLIALPVGSPSHTSPLSLPLSRHSPSLSRSLASADAKKRERCQAKASSTTTEALGVRICGMQVYSTESGKYLCQDKYHGRSLTPRTITEALRKYFELSPGAPPSSCARSRGIINGFLERMQHLTQVRPRPPWKPVASAPKAYA